MRRALLFASVPPSDNDTLSLARGEYDLCFLFASQAVWGLEAHLPITVLGGVHIGCFELFGNEQIRAITDLKNRTVGVDTAKDCARTW